MNHHNLILSDKSLTDAFYIFGEAGKLLCLLFFLHHFSAQVLNMR